MLQYLAPLYMDRLGTELFTPEEEKKCDRLFGRPTYNQVIEFYTGLYIVQGELRYIFGGQQEYMIKIPGKRKVLAIRLQKVNPIALDGIMCLCDDYTEWSICPVRIMFELQTQFVVHLSKVIDIRKYEV
jgi:hypothetical protein